MEKSKLRRSRRHRHSIAALMSSVAMTGCASIMTTTANADDAALIAAGRQIYENGILISGKPIKAKRAGGLEISGEEARCALCHQHSGMGISEGAIPVPPVSAPALFSTLGKPAGQVPRRAPGMEFKDYPFRTRPPYDEISLARALREGLSPSDYQFNYMMPRYTLDEPDMAALTAYLKTLSSQPSPGVDATTVHFATVIAADMDPSRQDTTVGVLKTCFGIHSPEQPTQPTESDQPSRTRTARLHVWELNGPANTWNKQLEEKYASQPVFALVSGLGTSEWAPVDQFCGENRLPCLFPNVEVPGSPTGGAYNFYFSKGVILEAEGAARYIRDQHQKLGITRVVQISRREGSGAKAAVALRDALANSGISIDDRVYDPESEKLTANLLNDVGSQDAVMLWLSERDLVELVKGFPAPPTTAATFFSGILGGLENAPLPNAWKKTALMIYPFDPPARWNYRMAYNLRPWLSQHDIPTGDERLQGNTLAACNLLFDGMAKLRNQYLRDYLVELTENYPTMGNAPAPQAYPRFSIGPGQRFSSKGIYVTRFAQPEFERLEKVDDWIVP